jgi:putative Mn2+ efflux pump MntP
VHIITAVCLIGIITFALSMAGVKAGSVFGGKYKSKAELTGGAVLVVLGLKILLEGMF